MSDVWKLPALSSKLTPLLPYLGDLQREGGRFTVPRRRKCHQVTAEAAALETLVEHFGAWPAAMHDPAFWSCASDFSYKRENSSLSILTSAPGSLGSGWEVDFSKCSVRIRTEDLKDGEAVQCELLLGIFSLSSSSCTGGTRLSSCWSWCWSWSWSWVSWWSPQLAIKYCLS